MTDNPFLQKVYDWGAKEQERGSRADLAGAAKYYAYVIVGDESAAPGIQRFFERVYEQGRSGKPLAPLEDE
jgi:NADPH-dependent ferric siderophore reductase